MMSWEDIERYEKLADQFERETGLVAPGKDIAAAAHTGTEKDDFDYRHRKWCEWIKQRADTPTPPTPDERDE